MDFINVKVGRCPDCGRFIKRGILNWSNHVIDDCPSINALPAKEFYKAIKKVDIVVQGKKWSPILIPLKNEKTH